MSASLYLAIAIAAEVAATTALKSTHGFTRLAPSLIVVAGYGLAFLSLSLSLRELPVGVAYATWAGVGTVCIAVAGWAIHAEPLPPPALGGIALIVVGVGLVNLYASPH